MPTGRGERIGERLRRRQRRVFAAGGRSENRRLLARHSSAAARRTTSARIGRSAITPRNLSGDVLHRSDGRLDARRGLARRTEGVAAAALRRLGGLCPLRQLGFRAQAAAGGAEEHRHGLSGAKLRKASQDVPPLHSADGPRLAPDAAADGGAGAAVPPAGASAPARTALTPQNHRPDCPMRYGRHTLR